MKLSNFLWMFGSFVLTVLVYFILDNRSREIAEEKRTESLIFSEFSLDSLESISIVHADGSYTLVKGGKVGLIGDMANAWVLKHPLGAKVDSYFLQNIIPQVLNFSHANAISKEDVLEDQSLYGLAPPDMVLTFEGVGRKKVVSFGKKNPVSGRRYLQVERDASIYLVPEALFLALKKSPEEIRDYYPVKFETSDISIIAMIIKGVPPFLFRLSKNKKEASSSWVLESEGKKYVADSALVLKMLKEISSLRVENFESENPEALSMYGLLDPLMIINLTVGKKDGKTEDILLQIGRGVGLEVGENEKGEAMPIASDVYYLKLAGEAAVYRIPRIFPMTWKKGVEFFVSKEGRKE